MSPKIKAIFWDMDGTMVDSEPQWEIATYEMSEKMGRRLTPELRVQTIGGSFQNTLAICANHAGISLTETEAAGYSAWMHRRMGELLHAITPNPGVTEVLRALQPMPMLVTTNTQRSLADTCIDVVGRDYFVGSITGDEVDRPKPAPDMYLAAARFVNQNPQECLVFEDSWNGMSAGVAAGCVVIGVADNVPPGATSLRKLHGSLNFSGVTPELIQSWFEQLR